MRSSPREGTPRRGELGHAGRRTSPRASPQRWTAGAAGLADQLRFHQYVQFLFDQQWVALKAYANEHGISIIGDVPIFVAYDSADAWAHPELFHFDAAGSADIGGRGPAGLFSPTGQLWGNPLYDWEAMAHDGYAWWIERVRRSFQQVDIVRLDHFRGFEANWAVPAHEETAENGEWRKGPGRDLFRAVAEAVGAAASRFIAEDLGLITPEVRALREACGFPGMSVLQFAFADETDNLYLPHNHERNSVVYTGTHDNDTTLGWFDAAAEGERSFMRRYLGPTSEEPNWSLIRLALSSVADTAIFPLQDVLGIGSEGRMNTPGRAAGNWGWRYTADMLTPTVIDRLRELTQIYDRDPRAGRSEKPQGKRVPWLRRRTTPGA